VRRIPRPAFLKKVPKYQDFFKKTIFNPGGMRYNPVLDLNFGDEKYGTS